MRQPRFLVLTFLLGGLCASGRHAHPAELVKVERVRVGFQNTFKVGCWTPVRVDLHAGPARFEGTLDIEAPDEDGTPTVLAQPVAIEAGGSVTVTSYIRPGTGQGEEILARVRDHSGRSVATPGRALDPAGRPPVDLNSFQTLIVTFGNPQGVADVAGLSAFQKPTPGGGKADALVVVRARPDEWPGRWYGLDGASVVVLDLNDRAVLDTLRNGRESLSRWVRNGGHLVVAGAAGAGGPGLAR